MNKRYFTVVFEHEGSAPFLQSITKSFKDTAEFHGVRIVAVSLEDEITRAEQLEQQLLDNVQ